MALRIQVMERPAFIQCAGASPAPTRIKAARLSSSFLSHGSAFRPV
jgi:hypothetical protein